MEEYVELLKGLIAIPSFSREETAVCDYLEQWLRSHGLDVHRKMNNVWLEQAGKGDGRPVILLNAHLDTVRPAAGYTRDPFTPTLDGDTLYGLGSNDDGASLVALLAAYLDLTSRPQPCRFIWCATAEEEVCGQNGIEAIMSEIGPVDLGIIGEPTQMQMAVAEKGLMVLDCTAHGKSGHAARAEGINALYKAMDDIQWFRHFHFEKESAYLGPVKMSVTMISAGTQHNVVPDHCDFVVDVRGNGIYSNLDILEEIGRHVTCEFKPRSTRLDGSSISMDHPVVRKGLSMGLEAFGSPTTSNQAVSPFTTIKIGPGQSSRSHTADEFILLSEIEEAVGVYVELLDQLKL